LIVESINGMKTAGQISTKTAAAHASGTSNPTRERRASRRSQRWHSAIPPGGSAGMTCVAPQSAQVIVVAKRGGLVQEEFPSPLLVCLRSETISAVRTAAAIIVLIGAPLLTGAIGAIASVSAPSFYAVLARPTWAPPASLFGPVWTTLYVVMGVAAFLVWRARGWAGARGALVLFLAQLVINGLWSWLFFHWRLGTASIADIVLLWLMVAILAFWFWRLRPISGALLLPYLAWVTFAAFLNVATVRLNPNLLL
jgi:tryptophan-rich sensory protein